MKYESNNSSTDCLTILSNKCYYIAMNITINNRELLRSYKQLKSKLLNGEIYEIRIPQGKNNKVIKITVEEDLSPTAKFLKMVQENGPINISRPKGDIFDW